MNKKKRAFKIFFHYLLNISHKKTTKGFTLTELLIAVFMSAIVISALLTAMVQILQADRRENQRTQVQQQTQSALNYISQDLKQAVYVYPGSSTNPDRTTLSNIQPFLPNYSNLTPILAFWKTQPILENELPNIQSINCKDIDNLTVEDKDKCTLNEKRNEYVLVVYYQSTANSTTWDGKSRIFRYELPKYKDPSTLEISKGYVDPSEYNNNFSTWPKDENKNSQQTEAPDTNVNPPVLVDFIDAPNDTVSNQLNCPTNFSRTPPLTNPPADNSFSFYACVKELQSSSDRQTVAIYLRGNEQKKDDPNFADTFRPVVQTQITIGGAIDKSTQN